VRDGHASAPEPAASSRSDSFATLPASQRLSALTARVIKELAAVLRLSPSRIDPRRPFGALGLESLLALEFRNRLEACLGLRRSPTSIWNYPTVVDLVAFLLSKMEPRAEGAPTELKVAPGEGTERIAPEISGVAALSEDEALQALLGQRRSR